MLQQIGKYNKISEGLMPVLPAPGTVVLFQYHDDLKIHDPIANKGQPLNSYPRDFTIPGLSKFQDPKTKNWIDIGFISYCEEKNGLPVIQGAERAMLNTHPEKDGGYLRLTIGHSALTDSFFQYLMLASFVGSNQNRDTTERVIFFYIDQEDKAKKEQAKQALQLEAMKTAFNLPDDKIKETAAMLLLDNRAEIIFLKPQVIDIAKTDPERFMAVVGDNDAEIKARIQEALLLDIVTVDKEKNMLRFSDKSKKKIIDLIDDSPAGIQDAYAIFAKSEAGRYVDQAIAAGIKNKATAQVA